MKTEAEKLNGEIAKRLADKMSSMLLKRGFPSEMVMIMDSIIKEFVVMLLNKKTEDFREACAIMVQALHDNNVENASEIMYKVIEKFYGFKSN